MLILLDCIGNTLPGDDLLYVLMSILDATVWAPPVWCIVQARLKHGNVGVGEHLYYVGLPSSIHLQDYGQVMGQISYAAEVKGRSVSRAHIGQRN